MDKGAEGAEVMRPAAELMKTALKAATRGSHDSAKIAKIREDPGTDEERNRRTRKVLTEIPFV